MPALRATNQLSLEKILGRRKYCYKTTTSKRRGREHSSDYVRFRQQYDTQEICQDVAHSLHQCSETRPVISVPPYVQPFLILTAHDLPYAVKQNGFIFSAYVTHASAATENTVFYANVMFYNTIEYKRKILYEEIYVALSRERIYNNKTIVNTAAKQSFTF